MSNITTVTRIIGDLVLNRAELCSRMKVQIFNCSTPLFWDSCLLESVII
jgi:hypothetical protein